MNDTTRKVYAQRAGLVLGAALPIALALALFASCGGPPASPAAPMAIAVAARPREIEPERPRTCAASLRVVRSLDRPAHVVAYVTTGHPKLDAFVDDLRAVLERYRAADPARFDFTIVDTKESDATKRAKDAGLQESYFVTSGDDAEPTNFGFMGLVLEYGAERDTIKLLSPDMTTGLEYWITNKLLEVRARAEGTKHRIGVLTGHAEIKLSEPNLVPASSGQSPNMRGILSQYFPYFVLVDVDLRKGTGAPIDDTLEGLVITQPATDVSDDELRRIDDFVLRGKILTVVASAVNLAASDPTMRATLSTHGLDKLLGGYGIEMRTDVLEDFGSHFVVPVMLTTGQSKMRFPAVLDVKDALLDPGFSAFFRIPEVPFPFASSLVLHREKQPDVPAERFRILARSSPQTARETTAVVALAPIRKWAPKGELAQYGVAAVVEGRLQSAFGPSTGAKRAAALAAKRESRVLVLSSSQFFANPFARAGNPIVSDPTILAPAPTGDELLQQLAMPYAQQILTNTILVLKNTVDWMTMDADLAACAGLPNRP